MTVFRQISLGIAAVILLAIVIGLVGVYFYVRLIDDLFLVNTAGPSMAQRYTDLILNSTFFWVFSLLLVILLVNCAITLLAMLLGIGPGHSRRLTVDTDGGQISVSLAAVEEFLQRKGSMVSGVKDLRIHTGVSGGLLAVDSYLVLLLDRDVPSFTREFQEILRNEVTHTLGFANLKGVSVHIRKMLTEEPPTRPVGEVVAPATVSEPAPAVEPTEEVDSEDTPPAFEPSDDEFETR